MTRFVDLSPFLHHRTSRARPTQRYNTDPPSAASTGKPVLDHSIFDVKRLQDAMARGLLDGIPAELKHPNDDLLIATVVAHGMPRWSAEQMREHPGLRLGYLRFWLDVQDAAAGDTEAQERVDVCRQAWDEARAIELISDRPEHTIGLWER